MPRDLVIQTEDLDPAAAAWLREACDLEACATDDPRFDALLARARGLVVRTYTHVGESLLSRAPMLKCVARAGVGLDRIDLRACRARGVEVVHTPDANSAAVAEYVFAMLLDALRPRLFLDNAIPAEAWNRLRRELEAPNQLGELRLGIVGLGRIGARVARIANGLEMDVAYYDVRDIPQEHRHGAVPMPLHDVLRRSDVITLHVDARPANHRLFNADYFRLMRSTAIFVNTSRGRLVDDLALAAFLRDNPSARALIDVHEPEPFPANYCLLGLPNAHLSPHLAASTASAHQAMSWVVRDLWRVLQGQAPVHPAPRE